MPLLRDVLEDLPVAANYVYKLIDDGLSPNLAGEPCEGNRLLDEHAGLLEAASFNVF